PRGGAFPTCTGGSGPEAARRGAPVVLRGRHTGGGAAVPLVRPQPLPVRGSAGVRKEPLSRRSRRRRHSDRSRRGLLREQEPIHAFGRGWVFVRGDRPSLLQEEPSDGRSGVGTRAKTGA